MNESELLARVCETNARFLVLGNESWNAHGALFIRNLKTPRRQDANFATLVRTDDPDEIEALLRGAEDAYQGLSHRLFSVDALTPRAFVVRLAMEDGYTHSEGMVQVLEGELNARPRTDIEVREVLSDADWEAYLGLDAMWWQGSSDSQWFFGPYNRELHEELMVSIRIKSPAVRRWFAVVDGEPRAFFAAWPGENGVGMVEDLFTHPEYRNRGLASVLIAHCVADARARGAGPVIINSAINDTPKHYYARLGFRPFYVHRSYTKRFSSEPPAANQA